MDQAAAELKVKLERVENILFKRLPQHFYDTFGFALDMELLRMAVLKKHAELQELAIKESLSHLSPEDIVLAIRHFYAEKKEPALTSEVTPPERKKRSK